MAAGVGIMLTINIVVGTIVISSSSIAVVVLIERNQFDELVILVLYHLDGCRQAGGAVGPSR